MERPVAALNAPSTQCGSENSSILKPFIYVSDDAKASWVILVQLTHIARSVCVTRPITVVLKISESRDTAVAYVALE